MLFLNGEEFAAGRSKYSDSHSGRPEPTAKVFVKVRFPRFPTIWLAQLDTGAAFSMLETALAEALGVLDGSGEKASVDTRFGTIDGKLERIPLVFIADEGRSLDVEATFFVSQDWSGGTFIGYAGLLDRIRIALDPAANFFYFGETE